MVQQALIPNPERARLKRTFRKDLKAAVGLRVFTQKASLLSIPGRECRYCPQAQQLMEELAALSPKLNLEIVDFYADQAAAKEQGIAQIPAIVLGTESGSRVRFFGMPIGYGLGTIIEDIMTISRKNSPLSMDTRKRLRSLDQPVHIQVFVTPGSLNCAPMARLAHALAIESQHIAADVIEAEEFPALTRKYSIRSVPFTVINEFIHVPGAVPEPEVVDRVVWAGVRKDEGSQQPSD